MNAQVNKKSDIMSNDNIREIHQKFLLCGEPRNAILGTPDLLLSYIVSLLNNDIPQYVDAPLSEWYALISRLNDHNILPLIYWKTAHIPKDRMPPKEIVDILRLNYLRSKSRILVIERQLKEIITAFEKEGIRFIVLKGTALSYSSYPAPATRLYVDIDLLVLPDDVRRSQMILEQLGYLCSKKYFPISQYYYNEENYIYTDDSKRYLLVELHWDLNRFSMLRNVSVDQLFTRAIQVKTDCFIFEALSPVDNIIHLAMHIGHKHSNDIRLSWIYDVSLLCRDLTQDDWELLIRRSIEYRARLALEITIKMAQLWTGLKLPVQFSDFSKWPEPTSEEITAFNVSQGHGDTISKFNYLWPKSAPLPEKIKILYLMIFLPTEELQVENSHNGFLPLSYLQRWVRLMLNK